MSWEKPTYEEYEKATPFARMRYKWGLFVMVGAWITIFALFMFTLNYVAELTENPLRYGAEKFNLQCFCQDFENKLIYNFNETEVRITPLQTILG